MLSPLPCSPTRFMPSFQSPVPISGRPWLPTRETLVERQCAMLEQTWPAHRTRRAERTLRPRPRAASGPSRKATFSSRHAQIAGDLDVMGDDIRQPDPVIGDARPYPAPRFRQPPMLHVALDELARRGAQQLLARHLGLRHAERHHILKLVAKAVSAARLIERRTRPDAAGERLIEQPTVQQDVHRTVRRRHLNRAKRVIPETGRPRQERHRDRRSGIFRAAIALRLLSPSRRAGTRSPPCRSP